MILAKWNQVSYAPNKKEGIRAMSLALNPGEFFCASGLSREQFRTLVHLLQKKIQPQSGFMQQVHFFSQYDKDWLEKNFLSFLPIHTWLNLEQSDLLPQLQIFKRDLFRIFGLSAYQFSPPHHLPSNLLANFCLFSFLCQKTGVVFIEDLSEQNFSDEVRPWWQKFLNQTETCVVFWQTPAGMGKKICTPLKEDLS